jgi:hypothetical protein
MPDRTVLDMAWHVLNYLEVTYFNLKFNLNENHLVLEDALGCLQRLDLMFMLDHAWDSLPQATPRIFCPKFNQAVSMNLKISEAVLGYCKLSQAIFQFC